MIRTIFSRQELDELLSLYDIGAYQSHKPFEKGADQTNILLITTQGKFAFRYYEKKRSKEYVLFEIELLHHLAKHAYPSPAPIRRNDGEYAGMYNHKPFAIFQFMEGEHHDEGGNYRDAAKAIARLHTLTRGYKPAHFKARDRNDPDSCLDHAIINSKHVASRRTAARRLQWLKDELKTLRFPESLPQGVCHGDANPTNFLYQNDMISAVLDFDQSTYTFLAYDVASLIYWWAWPRIDHIEFAKARAMVEAYESIRELSELEKAGIYDLLKMINLMGYAWSLHDDKDYKNSQRRAALLNRIGRDQFYHLLFPIALVDSTLEH